MKRLTSSAFRSCGVAFGLAFVVPGCVAAEKSVGQETDTDAVSGSESESSPTAESGGETESGGGTDSATSGNTTAPTETGPTATGPTTTGPVGECDGIADSQSCLGAGCSWKDMQSVEAGGDFCGIADVGGLCYEATGDLDCEENPICDGDSGWGYRETGEGVWDVVESPGLCVDLPPGFEVCRYDGTDPDVCGCICNTGGGATLPPGFENDLEPAGCSDLNIYARNPEDSIGLVMHINDGIVAMVESTMENYTAEIDATDFDLFELSVGQFVTAYECNDAIENKPVIDALWTATAGTVSLEVVPNESGTEGGFATLTLNNVELTNFDDDVVTLDALTFEDIFVGWLPG